MERATVRGTRNCKVPVEAIDRSRSRRGLMNGLRLSEQSLRRRIRSRILPCSESEWSANRRRLWRGGEEGLGPPQCPKRSGGWQRATNVCEPASNRDPKGTRPRTNSRERDLVACDERVGSDARPQVLTADCRRARARENIGGVAGLVPKTPRRESSSVFVLGEAFSIAGGAKSDDRRRTRGGRKPWT